MGRSNEHRNGNGEPGHRDSTLLVDISEMSFQFAMRLERAYNSVCHLSLYLAAKKGIGCPKNPQSSSPAILALAKLVYYFL
jgi:hypothetical protein